MNQIAGSPTRFEKEPFYSLEELGDIFQMCIQKWEL